MFRGSNRRCKPLEGVCWLRNWLSRSGPVTGRASRSMTGSSTASGAPVMTARVRPSARLAGAAGPGDAHPRDGHSRAQVGDGHAGQGDPCRLQQPAGHLLSMIVAHGVLLVEVVGAAELAPELFGG